MSNLILLILTFLGFIAIGFLILRLQKQGQTPSVLDPQALMMLQQRIDSLNQELKLSLNENARQQQTSSFQMTSTVRDVTERLVKIEETNKQILNFSGQLENLQRVLMNPKHRGVLGEYYLETLLKNVFPPDHYQMQYKFPDGEIVDAVVFVQDKIIPVDSKFSLEGYNRLIDEPSAEERLRLEKVFVNDLKQRIVETAKYIRPSDGTMDFAFMFIPHEAIYYDLLINKIGAVTGSDTESLLQRAAAKYHVIIVSPTSFAAYLQTVLQGLNALKIEEQAKDIRIRVEDLTRHFKAYESCFQGLGKYLGTAVNQYNLASKEYAKIDKDIVRMTGQGTGFVAESVERPSDES